MAIILKAYANCDDVFLAWSPGEAIPNCLGFAIECRRRKNGTLGPATPLSNRVGFKADAPKAGDRRPSRDWPFQRYDWTDHAADLGDEISYRVVARVGAPGALADGPASPWTRSMKLDAECDGARALFNRGFVISQFVARLLKDRHLTLAELKARAGDFEDDIRRFLSGVLREELLALLAEVAGTAGVKAYAALYELGDDELETALIACGAKVEIVLANGSVKVKGADQNEAARKRLNDAGLVVHDRMVAPGALGHNKFVVLCRGRAEQPYKLLTGSTNWTTTGLCTQVNNAIVLPDADLAGAYLAHWQRLRDAGSAKPATLAAANPSPGGPFDLAGKGRATAWLTPVKQARDIERLIGLVQGARDGILFVMFNPGAEPLDTLLQRQADGFYVRGVVNQIGAAQREKIRLIRDGDGKPFFLDVIEPEGVAAKLAEWAAEVTRRQFLQDVGFAMTHSKVLVIDPFGERPVVVTGSHNFSKAASATNDDNFVIVEGNARLAEAYAVNCMMTYQHYRWRQYLQQSAGKKLPAFEFLDADAAWQQRLTSKKTVADQAFWL
jgi:phosphatidylserine/phosphatidylglycerophosphate/cardiolipin synthase-like enzyme